VRPADNKPNTGNDTARVPGIGAEPANTNDNTGRDAATEPGVGATPAATTTGRGKLKPNEPDGGDGDPSAASKWVSVRAFDTCA
jgi:hypothetical protein